MSLSEARNTRYERTLLGDTLYIPMAADAVIYVGGLVCIDGDGYAVPAADTADYKFMGVAIDDKHNVPNGVYDNDGGDDGDMFVMIRTAGRFWYDLALRTPQQDMLGAIVYVYDDGTVAVHKFDVTNDIRCGVVTRLPNMALVLDPNYQVGAGEVEITLMGEPFEWGSDLTTTTSTTTQGA